MHSLAKREYFTHHNTVSQYLHFTSALHMTCQRGKTGISTNQVLTTDLEVGANRPDLVIKDKAKKKTYITDVACPCDLNIHKSEATKTAKYIGLKGQLQKMWRYECVIIPVIIGGLGAVTRNVKSQLDMIPGNPSITMCQKITLLGSKKILMDVLSRSR